MSKTINFLKKQVKKYFNLFYDYILIRNSQLFDEDWYITNNPDIANIKLNPLIHFLIYGGVEGRDPNPNFSSKWYLETYKDVKQSLINPLVHYIKFGQNEGRFSHPSQPIIKSISNSFGLTNLDFKFSKNTLKKKFFVLVIIKPVQLLSDVRLRNWGINLVTNQ